MTAIEDFMSDVRTDVDRTMDGIIPRAEVEPVRLHEAIRWSVFAGGKRIRPALLYAVGKTFGASEAELSRTAAAIEMIHTYSIIHDDLPAMDDDDLRRGRASCHKQFGEATAILAGDVLQTLAFKAIAEDETLSADIRVRLISVIAAASGTPGGMVSGQQLDLNAETKKLSLQEIDSIHHQKTGALTSAAAIAGAVIGCATDEETSAIKQYAAKIGLLFQITDDLLDVTQPTEILGKTAGKDAAAQKPTYPAHYGIEQTAIIAKNIRNDAYEALVPLQKDTTLLRSIAELIHDRIN